MELLFYITLFLGAGTFYVMGYKIGREHGFETRVEVELTKKIDKELTDEERHKMMRSEL